IGRRNVRSSRVAFDSAYRAFDACEKLLASSATGSIQRKTAVVVREAFRDPQQGRFIFARVVVGPHFSGAESFYVPEMEEFMRRGADHEFGIRAEGKRDV